MIWFQYMGEDDQIFSFLNVFCTSAIGIAINKGNKK